MSFSVLYIKEKWKHSGFQRYFKNTGWMFGNKLFTLAVSFFVGAYIARYLGPVNYGLMNYAISFVSLFGFLASFGIDTIVNREIVKNHDKKDELIGTGFFIKLFGAIIAVFIIMLSASLLVSEIFTFILILLFSFTLIPQAFGIIETYFQSQVLAKNIVKAQISAIIISTILKIVIIFLNKGIFWLLWTYLIEASLLALFLIIIFVKSGHHFKEWKFNKDVAISLLKDSWPLMFSIMAIGIYMKIDQVIIKHFLGDEQVGLYAVAVKLSEAWYFIPGIICASIFPAIVNSRKVSEELFEARMEKLYNFMFLLSTFIAAMLTLLAEPIINLLFGNSYIDSINILKIYVWAVIPFFYIHAKTYYLIATNKNQILLKSVIAGCITSIIFNILLIKHIGIIGGAVSILLSYLLIYTYINIKDKNTISVQ